MASVDDRPAVSWIAALTTLRRESDRFVASQSEGPGRLFGGLIAAQALSSACATVGTDKLPQSLHAYFVRGGRPGVDVDFEVERTRDGRSFDTRRVTATQDDSVILELLASFHRPEPGADVHPEKRPALEFDDSVLLEHGPMAELGDRFEIRTHRDGFIGPPYWIRTRAVVEDDQVVRACALTYMSDMGLMVAARPPGTQVRFGSGMAASLDHSLWFHRPFHPGRWHCFEASSLNNSDSRGLALGSFTDANGRLIATMTQEALWRE